MASKRWLILAHSFNADGRAASQTVTDKIPHLLDAGIDITVVSAATGRPDETVRHLRLMPWGPSGIRFDFRHIMARRFGRGWIYRVSTLAVSILLLPFIAIERALFGLGNQASWAWPAARAGIALARAGEIDLVYSSGGAASAHHAAALVKAATGLPWIAEIHDPMVIRVDEADDGTRPRPTRNARYLQTLEQRICQEADHVWWFTDNALAYAKRRNPALGDKGFVVLPGARKPKIEGTWARRAQLNICHFGAITPDRSLWPLLRAIPDIEAAEPDVRDLVRIHVFGSELDAHSIETIGAFHLADVVIEHPRLPRDAAVREMFEADCLLLLHGDYEWCAEYVPSKLYEYFWARRPVLAITHRNPFLDDLLERHGAYIGHTFDPNRTADALRELVSDWRDDRLRPDPAPPVTVESAVETILRRVC